MTYSEGHWNNYEDRQMYSNTVGSTVTVKFNGTGIAVIGGIAKNGPIAESRRTVPLRKQISTTER